MSVNGMQSYMHVFDRTVFQPGTPAVLRGFFAARVIGLPAESTMEMYLTDSSNTLIDKGQLFKNKVKGPGANIVIRIGGIQVPKVGEYSVWGRVDGGEPIVVRVGRYGPFLQDSSGRRASIPDGSAPDELTDSRITELLAQAALADCTSLLHCCSAAAR